MYTLHPKIGDAGWNVVEVRDSEGATLFQTEHAALPESAHREAVAWVAWAEHVADGTYESIYYILAVPETWPGPPLGAHLYSGLHFKIGRSRNVRNRLQDLQTGTSGELIIHALEPGNAGREAALHEQFRDERRSGEWFSASPQLTRHVYLTWKRHRLLPPEHQFKVVQLLDRLDAYKVARQVMGHAPDMVNPSLNETWHGSILLDLVYTKLATRGGR